MKRNLKKNEAITLIALVVTIIVLIVLAGVSINLLIGDNGILVQATRAKQENEKANLIEKIKLEIQEKSIENSGNILETEVLKILMNYGEISDDMLTLATEKYNIAISDIYPITYDYTEYFETEINKLIDIVKPNTNDSTQQSIATDGDKFYVFYPSDSGYEGIRQIYDLNNGLLGSNKGLTLGHASNAAWYNSKSYVLGNKKYSQQLELYIIGEEIDIISLNMSKEMIWDGFAIYDGKMYCIGYDKNGNFNKDGYPTESRIDIIDMDTLTHERYIECDLAEHSYYTCQGFAIYENYAYVLTSPTNSNGEFINGYNLDKISLTDGSVTSLHVDAATFSEPEGLCVYKKDDTIYLVSTLVNRGGIYTIAKIATEEKFSKYYTEKYIFSVGKTLESSISNKNYGKVINFTNNRMVTENIYESKIGDILKLKNLDWRMNIYMYNSDGTVKSKTGWLSSEYTFEEECKYRIILKKSSEENFKVRELLNLENYIE